MDQTQAIQSRRNGTIAEDIKEAIRILNNVLRDATTDEWEQILPAISLLNDVIDRLEIMSMYMDYLIEKILEKNDIEAMRRLVERLRRPLQHLA